MLQNGDNLHEDHGDGEKKKMSGGARSAPSAETRSPTTGGAETLAGSGTNLTFERTPKERSATPCPKWPGRRGREKLILEDRRTPQDVRAFLR